MIQPSAILKYLADRRSTIGFWVAAALWMVVAIVANVAPYYETRGAYGFDGYEIVGFPFVFRRAGGFEGSFEFSHLALSTDIAIAMVFSLVVGAVAKRLVGRIGRRSRFAWCRRPASTSHAVAIQPATNALHRCACRRRMRRGQIRHRHDEPLALAVRFLNARLTVPRALY